MCDLPLGVLSYTLVLATVALTDISEAQAAVEEIFRGPRFRQLAVLPQPRHFGSWTEEEERGNQKDVDGGMQESKSEVNMDIK